MIKLKKLTINEIDYTDYAVWTLQGQNTLDESLDLQYIELKGTDINVPFKPFSDVFIEIENTNETNTKIRHFLVDSDTVTEIISNKTYNHNLLFIEESKWLERLFVEKAIRQPLIHDYTKLDATIFVEGERTYPFGTGTKTDGFAGNVNYAPMYMEQGQTYELYNPGYMTVLTQQQLNIALGIGRNAGTIGPSATLIISKDGEQIYTLTSNLYTSTEEGGGYNQDKFSFIPTDSGNYTFEISKPTGLAHIEGENVTVSTVFKFDVHIVPNIQPKPNYTIRDVCKMLLDTCLTLRVSETPLFSIAEPSDYTDVTDSYKKRIKEILDDTSPEFTFSKMSLFEAFKTIGDYAHFIPRLDNGKIYFDLLGRQEYADVESLGQYCSNTQNQGSNDFCNALDSQVNNLTNMDDVSQGSVSTPDNAGYRTLRTETGNAQITDQNIIIPTEENIENIVKLELGYLSDGTLIGDITPFVYEEDEYNTLSSYSNAIGSSKMYAIKYKQGSKNITGLSFERTNVISQAFESIAIINILHAKTGKSYKNENVFKLQYRITYIPSTNAKITQHKANKEDIDKKPLYIAYNQSASKVSSEAYGENLKGTISKIGNISKTKMFILPSFNLIPKCGTLYDKDYYISIVKYEVYPTFIKCELGLSKNYNNKSAYVEINSQLQFFEYDRNIIIDRYVVYEDYCEVGDDSTGDNNSLITNDGLTKFASAFTQGYSSTAVSCVKAQGVSNIDGNLNEVVLPVISLGIGNSILLAWHYEDSISAGNRAYDFGGGRYQAFVKYTDIYGEVDELKMKLGVSTTVPANYNEAVTRGSTIPTTENFGDMDVYFDTGTDNIKIKKGVGEIPHFSYQLHFISNKPDLIIGSGLTRKSPFVTSETHNYKIYLLNQPINKFETKIDLTNAVLYGNISSTIDNDNKKVKLNDIVISEGQYKGWAIVQTYENSTNNDFIIGENKNIKAGDTVVMPTFNFKRRIK